MNYFFIVNANVIITIGCLEVIRHYSLEDSKVIIINAIITKVIIVGFVTFIFVILNIILENRII